MKSKQFFRSICSNTFLAGLFAVYVPSAVQAEQWTDLRGRKTIEATMVGKWDDNVVLEMAGGKRITVKMGSLIAASRIQAEELAEKIDSRVNEQIVELRKQAEIAAAAAPPEPPQPQPAPQYIPPPKDVSAEEFWKHLIAQTEAGHVRVWYDAIPPSMKGEIDQIIRTGIAKIDPQAWNSITGVVHQVGDLLVTKQNWLFSHPRFEALPEDSSDDIRELVLPLAGFFREGFADGMMDHQTIQSRPVADWVALFDETTSGHLAAISSRFEDAQSSAEPAFEEGKDGKVMMVIGEGRNAKKEPLMKVEGLWVPERLVTDFDKRMQDAKTGLAEIPDGSIGAGPEINSTLAMVNSYLQPLTLAQDATEFHAAVEGLIPQIGPAMQVLAAVMPKELDLGFSLGGSPNSGGGSSPYGDGYGDDYGDGYDDEGSNPYGSDGPYGG